MNNDKMSEIFNFFNKSPAVNKSASKKSLDESTFVVHITGGDTTSNIITVSGKNSLTNEKLPLKCNWFLISNENIQQLPFQTNFYQPQISDVGMKIMLQVLPEVAEYEGMPKQFSLGPLQIEHSIQQQIDKFLLEETLTVDVIFSDQNAVLIINPNEAKLTINDQKYTSNQIKLYAKRETTNQFDFKIDENQTFTLKALNNIQRDLIIGVVNGFAENRHIYLKQVEEKQKGEDYFKQQLENIQEQLLKEQNNSKFFQTKVNDLQSQLLHYTNLVQELQKQNEQYKSQIEQLVEQKIFLASDVKLYKGQIQLLNQKIQELRSPQDDILEETKQKLEIQTQKYIFLQKETSEQIQSLEDQVEKLLTDLSYQRRKYLSLFQDKQQLELQQEQKQIKQTYQYSISLQDLNNPDRQRTIEEMKDEELNKLKQQVLNLEATIRRQQLPLFIYSLKLAYDQDIRKSLYLKNKSKDQDKGNQNDFRFLQHLVNNLAEIITEKEMSLQNQMKINKELMQRLNKQQLNGN